MIVASSWWKKPSGERQAAEDCRSLAIAAWQGRLLIVVLMVQVADCGYSKEYFRIPEEDTHPASEEKGKPAAKAGDASSVGEGEKRYAYAVQGGWPDVEFEYRTVKNVYFTAGILWPVLVLPAVDDSTDDFDIGLSGKLGYLFGIGGESGYRIGVRLAVGYFHGSHDMYNEPDERNDAALLILFDFGLLRQWPSGFLFGLDICPLGFGAGPGGGGVFLPPYSLLASKLYIGYSW